MFLVSILKLIVLFLVAMGIWHLLTRLGGNGPARPRNAPRPGPFGGIFGRQGFRDPPPGAEPPQPQRPTAHAPTSTEAVDLVKCRQCGAYIAASGAKSCGRPDCPQPR
jgi:hypothetical protein